MSASFEYRFKYERLAQAQDQRTRRPPHPAPAPASGRELVLHCEVGCEGATVSLGSIEAVCSAIAYVGTAR